jgi:1-pyrroline-5-carboxylate dehydrogenase
VRGVLFCLPFFSNPWFFKRYEGLKAPAQTTKIRTSSTQIQANPASITTTVAVFHAARPEEVSSAIDSALAAKKSWETLPFADRAAIFLKAAELVSGKYRYELMAATMVGQGKNVWQAEIDAAAELCDFLK